MLDCFKQFTISAKKNNRHAGIIRPKIGTVTLSAKNDENADSHVAPVAFMTADQVDVFFLRLLLHQNPARSLNVIRTADGTVHDTFESAARAT